MMFRTKALDSSSTWAKQTKRGVVLCYVCTYKLCGWILKLIMNLSLSYITYHTTTLRNTSQLTSTQKCGNDENSKIVTMKIYIYGFILITRENSSFILVTSNHNTVIQNCSNNQADLDNLGHLKEAEKSHLLFHLESYWSISKSKISNAQNS